MDSAFGAGIVLTVAGVVGYAVGTAVAYPGRAFTVAAVMIGLALAAVGTANGRGDGS